MSEFNARSADVGNPSGKPIWEARMGSEKGRPDTDAKHVLHKCGENPKQYYMVYLVVYNVIQHGFKMAL